MRLLILIGLFVFDGQLSQMSGSGGIAGFLGRITGFCISNAPVFAIFSFVAGRGFSPVKSEKLAPRYVPGAGTCFFSRKCYF